MEPPANPPEDAEQKEQNQFRKNLSPPTLMAVPFLALNRYDRLYLLFYMFIAIALLVYKNVMYPLPNYALACQGIVLAMLFLTQLMRYSIAYRSINQKEMKMLIIYLVTSVFVLLSLIFELRLQTYVLLGEVITNWVGIIFIIAQVICGIWVVKVFYHKKGDH